MGGRKPRTERRAAERALRKVMDQNEKLASMEPGGAEGRPIEVPTAAVIELRAKSFACPRCESAMRIVDHRAVRRHGDGAPLRIVDLECVGCGAMHHRYFAIQMPN